MPRTARSSASPSTRPRPACVWRWRPWVSGRATRASRRPTPSQPPPRWCAISPHTFTATAEVVRYLGADVVLVDIDPATLNIDPKLVEAAITPKTRCIIPVHYAGLAVDMIAILDIARKHGLRVVEDAAHALP